MTNSVVLACGQLRAVFSQQRDRIGHRIEIATDANWTDANWIAVVESIEGKPDECWPPSPPLQTIHLEARPEGQIAFLVGMAGTSHWSASVAADTATSQLTFDIACRVGAAPPCVTKPGDASALASTYRWLLSAGGPMDQQALQVAPISATEYKIDDRRLQLYPPQDFNSERRTIRWGYVISPHQHAKR